MSNKVAPEIQNEVNIDLAKIWSIIWYRKKLIVTCYAVVLVLIFLITLILPKKYIVTADILINKSNSTNLSEVNPFVVSDFTSKGSFTSLLEGGSSAVDNDMAILESDSVIKNVIKENDLRYKKGPREGELLLPAHFLGKNLSIDNEYGSNVISIKYKSNDRDMAYNVVKSMIANFQESYQDINTYKAKNDNKFISKAYAESKGDFEKQVKKLKEFKKDNISSVIKPTSEKIYSFLLPQIDRRLGNELENVPATMIEDKKIEVELEQEVKKLSLLKERLEWTNLVTKMAENASKIHVLKDPVLPKEQEYSEPKLWLNMLLGLVLSFTVASILVFAKEKTSKTLTLLDVDNMDNLVFLKNNKVEHIEKALPTSIFEKNRLFIVNLASDKMLDAFINAVKLNFPLLEDNISVVNADDIRDIKDTIPTNILLLSQIGYTEKEKHLTTSKILTGLVDTVTTIYIKKN